MEIINQIIGAKINFRRYLVALISFGILLQGCSTDNSEDNKVQPNQEEGTINEEFRPYVNRFITEMNQRGLNLSTNKLSVVFVDNITMPDSDRFCAYGYVSFQNSGNPRVEIIDAERCWGRRSETEKENLMFHELGHALLAEGHINGTLPNGSQRSLMCASETCNNYRVYNIYNEEQRSYYLDHLANNETGIPDWASEKIFSRILTEDSFDNGIEDWATEIGEDSNNEMPYEFYIDENSLHSSPNALAIKSTSDSSAGTYGHWKKTYTISDFQNCSNIVIRADISTEGLIEGTVGIAIDLLEKNAENEFEFFARYSNALRDNGQSMVTKENFEAQVICLPEETATIKVLLYMNSVLENTVATFDNLEIELYE